MYTRRLPHCHPEGHDLFITWRLCGSLPSNRYVPPKGLSSGAAFTWIDRYLDRAQFGPTWLVVPEVAAMIVDTLYYCEQTLLQYRLHAYVVMSNHVHVLCTPLIPIPKITHSLKGFTAREANRILSRTGHFWQSESYDHWLRDGQFDRIQRYIEWNPVRAGLVASPEDFPFSSATKKAGPQAGLQPRMAAPPTPGLLRSRSG